MLKFAIKRYTSFPIIKQNIIHIPSSSNNFRLKISNFSSFSSTKSSQFSSIIAKSRFASNAQQTKTENIENDDTPTDSKLKPDYKRDEPFDEYTHPRQRILERESAKYARSVDLSKKGDIKVPISASGVISPSAEDYLMAHPIQEKYEVENVKITHKKCENFRDRLALYSVKLLRMNFDFFSGYYFGKMTEDKQILRILFLETVAGVPGMVGAMVRHLHSLRLMRRDYGQIHTLLEEAENERMHLLTAMKLKNPGRLFRFAVLLTQGIFVNFQFLAYLISPKFCHRFVGYLEEEAVITYTRCIEQLDRGELKLFTDKIAPPLARKYQRLSDNAKMRDMFLSMRADEAHHREVNHGFASQGELTKNPQGCGK